MDPSLGTLDRKAQKAKDALNAAGNVLHNPDAIDEVKEELCPVHTTTHDEFIARSLPGSLAIISEGLASTTLAADIQDEAKKRGATLKASKGTNPKAAAGAGMGEHI